MRKISLMSFWSLNQDALMHIQSLVFEVPVQSFLSFVPQSLICNACTRAENPRKTRRVSEISHASLFSFMSAVFGNPWASFVTLVCCACVFVLGGGGTKKQAAGSIPPSQDQMCCHCLPRQAQ